MSNQSSASIPEDTPQYRSVMLAPSMAPPMPRSFSIAPPKPLRRSSVEPKISKSQQSAAPVQVWRVNELVSLPEIYPLERTNVYVDNSSAQEVADCICECLRIESISATFDEENKVRFKRAHSRLARNPTKDFD
jgi:hypothetical protein